MKRLLLIIAALVFAVPTLRAEEGEGFDPGSMIIGHVTDAHSWHMFDYVKNGDDFRFTDGFVDLPKLPGLGVTVNRELVLEENKTPHNWKNPVWHHKDGSVAEW